MKYPLLFTAILTAGLAFDGQAQNHFTLSESIDYALKNNSTVRNAVIDTQVADNSNRQVRSKVLPQLDAGVDYVHNFNVQKIILENGVIAAFNDPSKPAGSVLAFQLQLNNVLTGSLTASQIIYDRSLFAGLESQRGLEQLSEKNLEKTKIDIAAEVTKSYYGVLVAQKQRDFLTSNLGRVDSLYRETLAKYKSGLVRKIDVDRIEVQLNNLKEEKEKSTKIVLLNKALLLYQMNINPAEQVQLSDTLNEQELMTGITAPAEWKPSDRIEYAILQQRQELSKLESGVIRGSFSPRVYAYATTGYNPAATNLGDIFQGSRYYNYTFVGLRASMPIFHGFEKKYKLEGKRFADLKLENSVRDIQQVIQLEVQQAEISVANSLESLKTQKRNLDLAQENVRIIRIENMKGVATNTEVTNAEGDLKEAQTNYYNTLYGALIAKTNLEKARGSIRY